MSGGRFDYNQYKIRDIANEIEKQIYKSGTKKTKLELDEESWRDTDWYEKYPEDLYHRKYSKEVIKEFIKAYKILRVAEIYAHRIDWLLSDDDGEETFMKRLYEDLKIFDNELVVKKLGDFKIEEYDE